MLALDEVSAWHIMSLNWKLFFPHCFILMLSISLNKKLVKLLQRMPERKFDQVYSIRLLVLVVSSRMLIYDAMKVREIPVRLRWTKHCWLSPSSVLSGLGSAQLLLSCFCNRVLSLQLQNGSNIFQQRLHDRLKSNMGYLQASLAISAVSYKINCLLMTGIPMHGNRGS